MTNYQATVELATEAEAEFTCIACSSDQTVLAASGPDGPIIPWDTASRQLLGELRTDGKQEIADFAFSPDSKVLAAARNNGTINLWEVAARQPLGDILTETASVQTVAFSPNGATLASGSADGAVGLWDVASHHRFATARAPAPDHTAPIAAMSFRSECKVIVAVNYKGEVSVQVLITGDPERLPQSVWCQIRGARGWCGRWPGPSRGRC